MSGKERPRIGAIAWIDLTVDAAQEVRDFYQEVVGWTSGDVEMGGYADFTLHPPGGGDPVAGVCHARGPNAELPAQWLIYVTVADLDRSLAKCQARGGSVLAGPKGMGSAGRYAVIRDPAGAVAALIEPAPPERRSPARPKRRRAAPARTPAARRRRHGRAASHRRAAHRRPRRGGRRR
jgi:predicted enzyme related to lactoylglutathione lyase